MATVELTREVMQGMTLDMLRGVAETIHKHKRFENEEEREHFEKAVPLQDVRDSWSKERCIAFILPHKAHIKKPKPPPQGTPMPKISASASNVPEGWQLK